MRVHYPEGLYDTALQVARSADLALGELTERLAWVPEGPIDIVVADETDGANGFATVLPYNLIGLNAAAPGDVSELARYDDWLYGLVAHELTHVVHMDTVVGLPAALNTVLGRWFFPNGAQARWFVEGLATYFETALTGMGRVHSPYFDMQLRMAVLEGEPMQLDDISGSPLRWPQGTSAYLYGSYFVDYLVQRLGEDALRRISYDYGSRLLPWAMNLSAERASGLGYPALYDAFLVELSQRFGAQAEAVLAAGRREGEALTDRGQDIGPARVAADGTVYFAESPIGDRPRLKALSPGGEERVVRFIPGEAELALFDGGRRAVVAQSEVHDTYYVFGDLFLLDTESGALEQLTAGARAHAPDVSADGAWMVFAQLDGTHSVLRRAPLAHPEEAVTLVDLGPLTQVWSPRLSPDGRRVAFAGFRDGRRDVFLLEIESGKLARVTSDEAVEGGPCFSPDGAWVIFHSDRGGIFDLYAAPVSGDGPLRRLTRVLGGAFRPDVAAGVVVYQSYGSRGFDLARLPWVDPATLPAAEDALPAASAPKVARQSSALYGSKPYTALPTLMPRAWVPLIGFDGERTHLGFLLQGQDAVGRHAWALAIDEVVQERFTNFELVYANRTFRPGVELQASRTLRLGGSTYERNGVELAVDEEVWATSAATALPLYRRREASLSLVASYGVEWRDNLTPLTVSPFDSAPEVPDLGRFAGVRLALTWDDTRRYIDSISAEEGVRAALGFSVEDPLLGSEFGSMVGTLDASAYVENPLVERQVLGVTGFFGYGVSTYERRKLFQLRGPQLRDVLLELVTLNTAGVPQGMRGLTDQVIEGDAMATLTLEYRFPLVDLEAGFATLPFYLRTLHAAAFLDGAAVADHPRDLASQRLFSAGGELRLTVLVGYSLPLTVRFGYGRGLGSDSFDAVFLVMGNTF